MTTIYLIRHAEAEGNLYRIVQGHRDSALTDRGWRQVRALEKRLEGARIDAVYSSDLHRALATATAVSRPRGLPVQGVPDLREIRVGEWEELTFGEIARRDAQMLENFGKHVERWHVPGAETPREVLERAWSFLNRVAAENDGKTIALVSHGYLLRLLLSKIEGMTLEETGSVPHGDNTSVSLLEYDGGAFRLLYRDDNRHLRTEEYLKGETTKKRKNALETGLWFEEMSPDAPLYAEAARAVGVAQASGDAPGGTTRPGDASGVAQVSGDAQEFVTLAAHLGDELAGAVQFDPLSGRIFILYLREAYRRKGMGIQLVGQAVMRTRAKGGNAVSAVAPPDAAPFFRAYGFQLRETSGDGLCLWEKDIRIPKL